MTKALKENWAGIMAAGTKLVAECADYLKSLPPSTNSKGVALMLLRPLNEESVCTALKNMKPRSPLGINGIPVEIFLALVDTLIPTMTQTMAQFIQKIIVSARVTHPHSHGNGFGLHQCPATHMLADRAISMGVRDR